MILLLLLLLLLPVAAQNTLYSYAPTTSAPCPDGVLVRTFTPQTQALNPDELSYIHARESGPIPSAWADWLGNGSSIGYDVSVFNQSLPRIGVALGGQGYRTSQFGAGVFSALDARNTTARSSGTGGLLQVASYLAGSSGTSHMSSSCLPLTSPRRRIMAYRLAGTKRLAKSVFPGVRGRWSVGLDAGLGSRCAI